jgi:hypothetical protein
MGYIIAQTFGHWVPKHLCYRLAPIALHVEAFLSRSSPKNRLLKKKKRLVHNAKNRMVVRRVPRAARAS